MDNNENPSDTEITEKVDLDVKVEILNTLQEIKKLLKELVENTKPKKPRNKNNVVIMKDKKKKLPMPSIDSMRLAARAAGKIK